MTAAQRLHQVLPRIVDANTSVAVWGVDVVESELRPEEEAAVSGAVPKRRLEFERGRACARVALRRAGGPDVAIPVGPAREPVWPDGFRGAITHAGEVVAAAVVSSEEYRGIGIDIEVAQKLEPGVRELVLTPAERGGGSDAVGPDAAGSAAAGSDAVLLFSAKEAVHKAVFPYSRVWLDLSEVSVRLSRDPDAPGGDEGAPVGGFEVTAESDRARDLPLEQLRGRWADLGEDVVTFVSWRAS